MYLADCQKDSILQEIWQGIPSESTVSTRLPSLQTLAIAGTNWLQIWESPQSLSGLINSPERLELTEPSCTQSHLLQGKGYKLDLTEGKMKREESERVPNTQN